MLSLTIPQTERPLLHPPTAQSLTQQTDYWLWKTVPWDRYWLVSVQSLSLGSFYSPSFTEWRDECTKSEIQTYQGKLGKLNFPVQSWLISTVGISHQRCASPHWLKANKLFKKEKGCTQHMLSFGLNWMKAPGGQSAVVTLKTFK